MKRIITIVVIIALLALIVFRLKSNHDKLSANKNIRTDLAYVSVNVSPVLKMSLEDSLSLIGNLDAFSEVDVAAEAAGAISTLNAELGQVKSKGSVIATIDDKLKQIAVDKAKLNLSKLEKNLERYKNLYKGGTLTEQQLDDAQTAYDDAALQLQQAEKQLSDATILSPITGIVSKKQFEKGEFINIGSPIVTLVDISRLKIKLSVSETNVYQLNVGDKTVITTDVYPGARFEGNISYISPKGDETHNYAVEIQIANSKEYPLKSGTFANVLIHLPSTGEGLFIPRESLLGSVKEATVYIAENGKAWLKSIVVGGGNDQYLRVISGINENDKVVVNGQINLSDGKEIKIIN
jgi:membrane fusion protein, multidrug efflux system